jgi:hypothetical protein
MIGRFAPVSVQVGGSSKADSELFSDPGARQTRNVLCVTFIPGEIDCGPQKRRNTGDPV